MPTVKEIFDQDDWLRVQSQFSSASKYRDFSARYCFAENSRIRRAGLSLDQVLRARTKKRREIFEKCPLDGRLVREVNECAKGLKLGAEWDADIFFALFKGYILLEASSERKNLTFEELSAAS